MSVVRIPVRKHGSRLGLAVALVASLAAGAPWTAAQSPPEDARGMLSGPDLSLDEILARMSERSELFRSIAIRFTCEETRVVNRHKPDKGWVNDEERERYLLGYSRDERGRLVELRGAIDDQEGAGRPIGGIEGVPPMFAWTQLFDAVQARRFHFELVGSDILFYRPARIIAFSSAARYESGNRVSEWSGRVWVDVENFNLLRVEAEPNGQRERIQAELRRFQQSFKILGMPIASKPSGKRYEADFGYERYGVSFPTQTRLRSFTLEAADRELPEREIHQILKDYEFFGLADDDAPASP